MSLSAESRLAKGVARLTDTGRHRGAKAAFSLIEIMLALVLVSTAAFAVIAVYTVGLRQSVRAEETMKSTEMAREIMEMTRDLAFDDIPSEDAVFDGRVGDPVVGKFPPAPYPARGDYKAEVLVDQVGPDLKSVYVKVHHESGHSVSFQTYFRSE